MQITLRKRLYFKIFKDQHSTISNYSLYQSLPRTPQATEDRQSPSMLNHLKPSPCLLPPFLPCAHLVSLTVTFESSSGSREICRERVAPRSGVSISAQDDQGASERTGRSFIDNGAFPSDLPEEEDQFSLSLSLSLACLSVWWHGQFRQKNDLVTLTRRGRRWLVETILCAVATKGRPGRVCMWRTKDIL